MKAIFQSMKQFVQALSGRAEFLIVVLGSIGISLLSNFAVVLNPSVIDEVRLSNESLVGTLVYEVFVLIWLGAFMKARGWTFERLGFSASLRDTVVGIVLAILVYVAVWIIELAVGNVAPGMLENAARFQQLSGALDMRWVVLISIVNPVFEEVFVCAYIIAALKDKRGTAFALNVSVGLRVACHLYQGVLGVLTIAPVGFLFGYWYLRSGRIWPLLVAHALLDFIGLVSLGGQ
jgi:membrane protease YdiL (CAAX protease family)